MPKTANRNAETATWRCRNGQVRYGWDAKTAQISMSAKTAELGGGTCQPAGDSESRPRSKRGKALTAIVDMNIVMNTSIKHEGDIPGTLAFELTPTTKTVAFVSPPGRGRSLNVLSAQRGVM